MGNPLVDFLVKNGFKEHVVISGTFLKTIEHKGKKYLVEVDIETKTLWFSLTSLGYFCFPAWECSEVRKMDAIKRLMRIFNQKVQEYFASLD